MSDIWDPLGGAKGCLNYFSGCFIYAIIGGIVFGLGMAFVTGAWYGRWEHLYIFASVIMLILLLVPWIVHRIHREKEWYRILWECLGVGAAIIFFSGAFIPNIDRIPNRGRQKRTMADMRVIADKMDMFHEQQDRYPAFNDLVNFGKFFRLKPPLKDGWGRPLVFRATEKDYWIISHGRDGKEDVPDIKDYAEGATTSFDNDLVLHNGKFIQCPEGINLKKLK